MPDRPSRPGARRSLPVPVIAALLALLALLATTQVLADDPTGGEFAPAPLADRPVPRDLRELLALVDGGLPLRLTLASREQPVGHPWRVRGDTLQIVPPGAYEAGQAPRAGDLVGVPIVAIVRVEQSRSGARTGAGWGAKAGAAVMGGLGLFIGLAVMSLDEGDSDAAPLVAFTAVGAGAGALVGGGIGAGVGALGRDWTTLWPFELAGEVLSTDLAADAEARRAHFALEGAWSFDDGAETDGRGPGARLGLVRRLGENIELGPFAEYHDLRGEFRALDYYGNETIRAARSRMFALGLDARANARTGRTRFFGTAGIGWCLGDDLYLGAHGGGGLRWRSDGGHVVSLVLRRYFEVTGTQPREGRFWSVAAGITFGD